MHVGNWIKKTKDSEARTEVMAEEFGSHRGSWVFKVVRTVPELSEGEDRKLIEVPQPYVGVSFVR